MEKQLVHLPNFSSSQLLISQSLQRHNSFVFLMSHRLPFHNFTF